MLYEVLLNPMNKLVAEVITETSDNLNETTLETLKIYRVYWQWTLKEKSILLYEAQCVDDEFEIEDIKRLVNAFVPFEK